MNRISNWCDNHILDLAIVGMITMVGIVLMCVFFP